MWVRIGWAAACFGSIMGFSRLSYGLLVPAMHASLGGGLDAYGNIGAANLAGYFSGSLLATRLAERAHRARINVVFLIAMCAGMAASGFARDLLTLGILRFLVGAASGVALTLTLALAVEGVDPAIRGRAASVIWAGGSASMALAGAGSLVFALAQSGWRVAWVAMGALGIAWALVYGRITRHRSATARIPDDGVPIGLWARKKYLALALGYGAYGFGYICVLTFFGAALARTHAASLGLAVVILGGAGMVGALVWGPLVDRFRSGMPLAIACALCATGAFALSRDRAPLVLCGALVLGVSFIGVPAMIGALAQQREPGKRYARAFATLTSTLAVGQIVGPFAGGLVAEHFGTSAALELGAAALLLAAICCGAYRRPSGNDEEAYVPSASATLRVPIARARSKST
jgi:predicted MFS family arabinose efflux permease